MHTNLFHFELPSDRIAQTRAEPPDHAKLMVIDRKTKTRKHSQFFHIIDLLQKGDLIVWNNSKVFKARLQGKLLSLNDDDLWEHKRDIEVFLVRPKENLGVWQVLVKGSKHVENGMKVEFAPDFACEVILKKPDGTVLVNFIGMTEEIVRAQSNKYGHIPIPPYIKDEPDQIELYQTAYAKHEGSVAAPTAGFHFTPRIIKEMKERGVEFAEVTLHVGLGTFLPVKAETIQDHTMHSEWAELSQENADKINAAKQEGRRVITVGTTATRTLEGIAALPLYENYGGLPKFQGDIDIFITPGFHFKMVDALITNFHLPKSTLLMLVSAFVGDREYTIESYIEAVEQSYRFYSFGDAMFIV